MRFEDFSQVLAKADVAGWRRVLIVTALPLEMSAIREHTEHTASSLGRDGNVFELGHFTGTGSDWLVVVGETGAGNHQSQAVVTNACIQFGPFELIIFVGVAATRKADDAPIGSVVISDRVYLASVGKYKDGSFYARPRELVSDARLVGMSRKVARDEKWHERLKPPYGGITPSQEQYPKPFPPIAKIAAIISTEAVSADDKSVLEQQITSTYQDATALEMEGYGAIYAASNEHTPCIVVRGISDDRGGKDPKLDKIYQPIAAAHGAAFAYELLDVWGSNQPPPQTHAVASQPVHSASRLLTTNTTPAPTPAPITSTSDPKPNQLILVLNFSGHAADFPVLKQQEIVEVLRKITGNPTINIVGAQAGSFHLFVKANEADLAKLRSTKTRSILSRDYSVELLGVTTKDEFDAAHSEAESLLNASRAVLDWPRKLPDGTAIERPELSQLLNFDEDDEGCTKAVIGDPGSGKTALLATLADLLTTMEVPFLAIKADFLDPNITDEESLQRYLRLPDLPSNILERLSYQGPVFLLIDQLDALAGYVDLRTGRLSVLLNLVRALGMRRNIHIVLSARRFEFEHDTRLKVVRAESVPLELPPWSTVLQILETNGIKAAGWPADAQQVMRSPQSLSTFLRLADPSKTEPFGKYQQMLERLWSERVLNRANGNRLSGLAGKIAEDMAERETLWLASSRYDSNIEDIQTLLSEKILTTPAGSPGSIGFSHQTVFEFALARSFAQQQGRLSAYVRERATSLFIRPKLWAALTYLRGVEPTAYEAELLAIWSLPNLRLHLRHLIIEFLGQQSEPESSEMRILAQALTSEDRRAVLQAIIGSKGWFFHFRNTEIARAMVNPSEANVATGILSRAFEFGSDEILALVEKYWLLNKEFDGYAWHILEETPTWSDAHLKIASTIVERTEIAPFAFDHMVSTIGANQHSMAIKLVLARLNALLSKAKEEADEKLAARKPAEGDETSVERYMDSPAKTIVNLVEHSDGWDGLEALAKADPPSFLAHIWPWFHEMIETIKYYKEEQANELSFPIQYELDYRFEDEGTLDLPEPSLLGSLRVATEALATQNPERFLAWFKYAQDENATPAQRLLAHTLSTQPKRFASDALAFLLADTRRFNLGSIEDYSGTTKRLIKEASPFWSHEQIEQFVAHILAFAPRPAPYRDAKGRQFFYRYVERIRFELLNSLSTDKLPARAEALIKEGERKFGNDKRGATFTGPDWIGSSMSADAIGHAADGDVLNAFQALPDATGWDNPKHWLKGGNIQLSRAFADFAKKTPQRAIEIMQQFSPAAGARAAGYAIDAMGEFVDAALITPLIKELDSRGFASDEFRGGVARGIEKLINRDVKINDDTLAVLESWLSSNHTDWPDDSAKEATENEDKEVAESEECRTESILWGLGGVTILPQGNFPILETVIRILLQRKDYVRLLNVLNDHLRRPEDEKVWTALLRLFPFINLDDKAALARFYESLFEKYPRLATSREAAILLAHLQWSLPDFTRGVLVQWETHPSQFLQQAYGELATLIWLMQPNLEWPTKLVNSILASNHSLRGRTGAAYAAIHVWAESDDKAKAAGLIRDLSKNASNETWKAIIDLFRLVDEITPDADWVQVLRAIAEQIPDQDQFMSSFVIERLQTLLPHEADLVASISKALVEKWQSDLGDIRTSGAAVAPEFVDIAITLHRLGPDTREQGLAIFEQLLAINAYTARDTLDQVDNRFRSAQPAPRARLPRRAVKARRRRRKNAT
jgi:nucleoside phosphorylase